MVKVIAGFSLTNRLLLYASSLLSPGQALSGIGSNLPTNIGFLAYNWYNQYVWYTAIKNKELHALSLLPIHFNLIYALTYLGGVISGNIYMALILGFGTAALMIFNTIAAWKSWATNMPEGFHIYQFFFFGWRTLTPRWHRFFLLWQIGDTLLAVVFVIVAIVIAIVFAEEEDPTPENTPYCRIYLGGSLVVLLFAWELIMWVELIVSRNHIESATDMIAVWLFVAQIGTMVLPYILRVLKAAIMYCKPVSTRADHTLPLVNVTPK